MSPSLPLYNHNQETVIPWVNEAYKEQQHMLLKINHNSVIPCKPISFWFLSVKSSHSYDMCKFTMSNKFPYIPGSLVSVTYKKMMQKIPLHDSLHKHEMLANSKLFCLAFYPQHAEGKQLHKEIFVRQNSFMEEQGILGKAQITKSNKASICIQCLSRYPF